MAPTPGTVTLRMRVNTVPLQRALFDAGQSAAAFPFAVLGLPRPPLRPLPRRISPLTSREYRARRRRYGRELRTWRRAVKAGA